MPRTLIDRKQIEEHIRLNKLEGCFWTNKQLSAWLDKVVPLYRLRQS